MTLERATIPAFTLYTWESQVRQYPKVGPPGIGYYRGELSAAEAGGRTDAYVDCLLYRNSRGAVIGILNHYPMDLPLERAGNVNVWVHPRRQRRGIGTALARAAARRWTIDLEQQSYTDAGLALGRRLAAEVVAPPPNGG